MVLAAQRPCRGALKRALARARRSGCVSQFTTQSCFHKKQNCGLSVRQA
jgi:hypothetical protein